ncbi:hypothetical protein ACFYXM_11165 [Streptomyces sp. NPDC002476]|uniref:hypothetical protein n=1 Tax=Streptomyces sp. NPDC002476 TaxID=3364648 RepID=UPI003679E8A0
MRISISLDLGGCDIDGAEPTVEFTWDIGALPLPRSGERVAFGEVFTVVHAVQYLCPDGDSLTALGSEANPVSVALLLALRTESMGLTTPEIQAVLCGLPCVSDVYVPGIEPDRSE